MSAGLSQQACTRPFRLSGALGSIWPCRTRQRKVAWICAAGAAKPVVKVEVAEGGVEVVAPEQADHPAAEPDAFRVAGRPGEQAGGFGDLVDASSGLPWRRRWPISACPGAPTLPLWAKAGTAAKLNAATQNAVRNRRKRTFDIVPPVLNGGRPPAGQSAMRPDWDANAAFCAGRCGNICCKSPHAKLEPPSGTKFPAAQTWPEPAAFVQRLATACLKPAAWQRRKRAISRPGRCLIPLGRVEADAPCSSLPGRIGGGDRRRLGLARCARADAAIPARSR